MANCEIEMLHEIAESMSRFMENQTRIVNSLVSQVKELKERVVKCEMSQENLRDRLDVLATEDTSPELSRIARPLPHNENPIRSNASRRPSVEAKAPPIASRRRLTTVTSREEEPRPVPRRSDVCKDRRAPLKTRQPVPLPRTTRTPNLTENPSTPRSSPSVRFCDTFAIEQPCQRPVFTAPPGASAKVKVSPQKSLHSTLSSSRSSSFPGSPPSRTPPFLGSTLSPHTLPGTRPSPPSPRRHQERFALRRERPSNGRTPRVMERGVRGHIRTFIEGRDFAFVTREDNGGNVFMHRNELINIPRDSAITLQEGDEVLFDVMRTNRTPTARNARLLKTS